LASDVSSQGVAAPADTSGMKMLTCDGSGVAVAVGVGSGVTTGSARVTSVASAAWVRVVK